MLKNNIFWLNILGVIFLGLILRWNTFSMPLERDEGEYAYSAWILSQGKIPYRDAFLQKPPLIIYTYLFGQLISPNAVWPPRLLAAVFALGTTFLTGLILCYQFNRKVGLIAMWMLTPMLAFPYFMGTEANTEIFMLLPLTAFVFFYFRDRQKPQLRNWFLAGVMASLAVLFKPICLYQIAFIMVVWLVSAWRAKENSARIFGRTIAFAASGILTAFLVLLPIIARGAFSAFWETAISFNALYAQMWGLNLAPLFRQLQLIVTKWWVLVVFIFWFFVIKPKSWWFYLGLAISAFLGVFQTPIGHYYLLVMPSLAIMAAIGFNNLLNKLPYISALRIGAVVLVLLILPVRQQFGMTPQEIGLWIYGTANPFDEAPIVAAKLAEITRPEERVFVAGSEPEILFYARRFSATRFVITYPLIMDTPKRLDYQNQAIRDLEENRPAAIVVSQKQFSGLWDEKTPRNFIDYLIGKLNTEYRLVGGYVWTKAGDYWLSELNKEDVASASLLLYRRI